ncbi:MAG: nitrogenase-associated protein [Candidatus Thiodiazotropha sp.]
MSDIRFYEKPGCFGNQQQKSVLLGLGHRLEIRDLLSEPWTVERLRPFFANKPVTEWFNLSAPKVKSGEIDISTLDERQALAMMIKEPLLICRPLLQQGELRQSGFLPGPLLDALGISLDPHEDLQSCPMTDNVQVCEEPA